MRYSTRLIAGALSLALLSTAALAEYRPPNVALPATSSSAIQPARAPKKVIKVCTGKLTGVYFAASQIMAKFAPSVLIQPVLTEGSLENAQKVSQGLCDVGFVQEDALRVYRDLDPQALSAIERQMAVYKEYIVLLCNREAGITKLSQLRKGHVIATGTAGTGSQVTWEAISSSDKKRFGPEVIEVSDKSGIRALTAIQDGAEVTCSLSVTGLGDKILKNDAQRFADKVVMVNINETIESAKDARGKPIYSVEVVPAKTYGALMPAGALYGTNDAKTIGVDAVFIGNKAWVEANGAENDALLSALTKGRPMIADFAAGKR